MADAAGKRVNDYPLPYCIQGSAAPAFRGEPDIVRHFDCSCGHRLIEHFDPDAFIRVAIKCFACAAITETPPLPVGEILPRSLVTLGADGGYLLGSTVYARSGVAITCDQEIARTVDDTAPRMTGHPDFELSVDGLARIEAQYDALIGGRLASQQKSLLRYPVDDRTGVLEFPFAWATGHLRKTLLRGTIDFSKAETATALAWIEAFRHVTSIWGHHPRFASTATTLAASFLHTIPQLIVAAYLCEAGNRVGLAASGGTGTPVPDLYIRHRVGEIFHIEVKAPKLLQWCPSMDLVGPAISKAVTSALENSRHQINSKRKGVLVISSSLMHPELPDILEAELSKALASKGRNRSGVAAIVSVSPLSAGLKQGPKGLEFGTTYAFRVSKNPHFAGENPVVTGE